MKPRPPLATVLFVILGLLLFVFFAMVVESRQQEEDKKESPPSPPPPPPPPSPPESSHKTHQSSMASEQRVAKKNGKLNTGMMIGLLFVGIGVVLQIGVVGFLAFKRMQLLKMRD